MVLELVCTSLTSAKASGFPFLPFVLLDGTRSPSLPLPVSQLGVPLSPGPLPSAGRDVWRAHLTSSMRGDFLSEETWTTETRASKLVFRASGPGENFWVPYNFSSAKHLSWSPSPLNLTNLWQFVCAQLMDRTWKDFSGFQPTSLSGVSNPPRTGTCCSYACRAVPWGRVPLFDCLALSGLWGMLTGSAWAWG